MAKFFFVTIAIFILFAPVQADVLKPDYEVKFYLSGQKVLQPASYELKAQVEEYFAIYDRFEIVMEFLDSCFKDLYNKHWVVRIRDRADKQRLELTYKYRIPIIGSIEEALYEAENLGWDSTCSYGAEVDWGYRKQTLSIAKKKKILGVKGLPKGNAARRLVIKKMPGKLGTWGKKYFGIDRWASAILEESHIFGKVKGERHVGILEVEGISIKVCVEVWNIAGKTIVEFSFKTNNFEQASILHKAMKKTLSDKGWLLKKDILKTRLILESY